MVSFAELFEQSQQQQHMQVGSVIPATVIRIEKDYVIVDAGFKSEGAIPIQEFYSDQGKFDVNVDDEVEVVLLALEDGFGETRFSREKAKRAEAWRRLEKACEAKQTVTGIISGKVKGGFTVEIDSVRAFLPGSLVDVRPVRDMSYIEGKALEFKVIKMDAKRNNVVVSRRAVVEEENSVERQALLENLEEGKMVVGIVKNLTDYGAFIDLGGIDGLLHITDMSWKRIKHPSELLNVGDEIKVVILKFDRERNRVSLGYKQLAGDPWVDISRRYAILSRFFGKVTNITDYGCFVELEEGVEGLVHISELSWTNKNIHPSKVVQLGNEVEVMVLEIDEERRRISLGIKQCTDNPWGLFAQNHTEGDKVVGAIKSITDFGIFIGLEGGIDGLVHLNDISWAEPGEQAIRNFKKGQEIEAVVLAVDPERERISLGIKQLLDDPFNQYIEEHPKGSIVTGKVVSVEAKGATVELEPTVQAYIKAAELSRDKVKDVTELLHEGDSIEAKIIHVDRKNRTINLSIKAKEAGEEKELLKNYGGEGSEQAVNTPLGDLLKQQMETKEQTEDKA
jgi:small subunit ribosomal protein S1